MDDYESIFKVTNFAGAFFPGVDDEPVSVERFHFVDEVKSLAVNIRKFHGS